MTQEQFNLLFRLIRKGWTKRTGIVVRLQHTEDDTSPLLLCVGCLANPGFIAQNCKVWEGDNLLYEGSIMSDELKELLEEHNICHAEVSTVRRLDTSNGVFACLGNREACDHECALRKAKKAQIGSVDILIK